MSKSPRRPNPVEQYDRFMTGSKTAATPRGLLLLTGGLIGNTILWLAGLITVARLGTLLAFFIVAAVALGVLQRLAPALDLAVILIISAAIALVIVAVGLFVLTRILRRDAQRLGQQPTFGVFDEDARKPSKQNYRRKAGR